jgi:hypothetical protein
MADWPDVPVPVPVNYPFYRRMEAISLRILDPPQLGMAGNQCAS